jgi:hypothetical protein
MAGMGFASSWKDQTPDGRLYFALLLLLFAAYGTFTGKLYGRGGMVDRAKNPFDYWLGLAICYLAIGFLIWAWGTNFRF